MAKKPRDESELNMDSLMDAVTNVVGVLMIIFVMLSLNLANSVRKVLSELPPVTPEQHEEMQQQLAQTPPPVATPEELEEKKKAAEQALKAATEELSSVDVSQMQMAEFMDLDEIRKRLEEARLTQEKEKSEVDKLLTEVERLKALLDETPVYQPEDATIVRLPNPRPYPENPNEIWVMVAKEGSLFFDQQEFMAPLVDGLTKAASQLTYDKDPKPDPFAKVLNAVLGKPEVSKQAWPDVAPLAGTFQMQEVAEAWKSLRDAGLPADSKTLLTLGDLALSLRTSLPRLATAIAALTKGDVTSWTALDPSKDPAKPTIKATTSPKGFALTYGAKAVEVENNPRDLMGYFAELAGRDGVKNRTRDKVIYDAFKIEAMLKRAATNQAFTKSYGFEPKVVPGQTAVKLALTPSSGAGETVEQMKAPDSNYQRVLRKVAGDPNGVAVFKVKGDAFATYLEARLIADENNVAATWEFLQELDISLSVPGFEVQRFAVNVPAKRDERVRITGPKRTLD